MRGLSFAACLRGRPMSDAPSFFVGTGMPDRDWWSALFADPAAILASVGLKPGMSVVDLCAGDGHFTNAIAATARHVWAIDLSAPLLAEATQRAEHREKTTFIIGDAYDVAALVGERVDLVFLANSFHGVPDKARLADAVWNTLKPGGAFVILNWHAKPRESTTVFDLPRGPADELRMTPEAVAKAVVPSGFRLNPAVEVPPFHYAATFTKT